MRKAVIYPAQEYTPPARSDSIDMNAKGVPASPGEADLKRGYVKLPCGDVQAKTGWNDQKNAHEDAEAVDGFVPRANTDERL